MKNRDKIWLPAWTYVFGWFRKLQFTFPWHIIIIGIYILLGNGGGDALSPLGSPIVLQRKGSVYGANVPMITELVNDSNVQFLDQVQFSS